MLHPILLQHLSHADAATATLIMPRLEAQLATQPNAVATLRRPAKSTYGAQHIVDLLLAYGIPSVPPSIGRIVASGSVEVESLDIQ